jgi:polyribonucleotide nucleotidyltransferase
MVYAKDTASANAATKWINVLVGEIEIGEVFDGTVRRITDFGMFVELVPGKDGLIHISNIARSKQRDLNRLYQQGDKIKVKVASYDRETERINLISSELKEEKNNNSDK